jgi:hypothetical protein
MRRRRRSFKLSLEEEVDDNIGIEVELRSDGIYGPV